VATSFGFLSTYPPTQCGLATFTASLVKTLNGGRHGDRAGVVRIIESPVFTVRPEVVEHLNLGAAQGHIPAADALNRFDVAVVQHEYGIFSGPDGENVLAVLDRVRVPIIVVLHTVLRQPTPHQRAVLDQVCARAEAVVTMTETARDRLLAGYDIVGSKVTTIPHGAVEGVSYRAFDPTRRPTILTWGLLGPGKGIEWGLIGLRELRRMHPAPRYVVAGQTHPKVRAQQGEAYRIVLGLRARALGVTDLVRFERSYLDSGALARLIDQADVVLLPYDSVEQVTSGVLIEAIAAHKPVVATPFPHAVEMLSGGAGMLVPHRDGAAIGAALKQILTDPVLAGRMSAKAAQIAPGLSWPAVADRYRGLADLLLHTPSAAAG
jgi:glycosyltransferase involved in cell wall biosynthesis